MEDATNDQSPFPGNTDRSSSKLLRYPLRSATKLKEVKTPVSDSTISSASKRGRPPSSVSRSVGDLPGRGSSAKPARRLSIPTKATPSPAPKPGGSSTPVSEARAKKFLNTQGENVKPVSDMTKSSSQKKFIAISSASYWLFQIKLSESAEKHSISLGFFKLALEAGCEPVEQMREELKSYASRHNLVELGDCAKELFESYTIAESIEQMQVSETVSHVPEEGTQLSDDDVHSSSSAMGNQKLKPKSLNTGCSSPAKGSVRRVPTKSNPTPGLRASVSKISANSKSTSDPGSHKTQKQSQKSRKEDLKKLEKNSASEEAPSSSPEELLKENKENQVNSIQLIPSHYKRKSPDMVQLCLAIVF